MNKASLATASTAGASLTAEYDKLLAPDATLPSPPVYAARLSGLLKNLASASGAVAQSIKARQALIQNLQKLLVANQASLTDDQALLEVVETKKGTAEAQKQRVEDDILKGWPADTGNVATDADVAGRERSASGIPGGDDDEDDHSRPQMEELTPPPVESFTPEPSPPRLQADLVTPRDGTYGRPVVSRPFESGGGLGDGGSVFKKRKLDGGDPLLGGAGGVDAMADLDDDVAELLRSEGAG